VVDNIENADYIRVIDLAGGQRFTAKKLSGFAYGGHGLKDDFKRNPLSGALVVASPHGRHSTFSNELVGAIPAPHHLTGTQDCFEVG
jgi:hypothetical protein